MYKKGVTKIGKDDDEDDECDEWNEGINESDDDDENEDDDDLQLLKKMDWLLLLFEIRSSSSWS